MTQILNDNIESLIKATDWLSNSYERCSNYNLEEELDYKTLGEFEALVNRFRRTFDILIQKVYRSIDHQELETQGSLIDVVNRAHKRELIDNVDTIRQLKDLRNSIAHEYAVQDLTSIFALTLKLAPKLLDYVGIVQQYVADKKFK